jgi:hypothetical protein
MILLVNRRSDPEAVRLGHAGDYSYQEWIVDGKTWSCTSLIDRWITYMDIVIPEDQDRWPYLWWVIHAKEWV